MKKASLYFYVIFTICFLMQSCSPLLEGSGDEGHVEYKYDGNGNQTIRSPSGSDFGLNVAVFFMLGSADGISNPSHTFNNNSNSSYTFTLDEHGPFYSDTPFPDLNDTYQYEITPPPSVAFTDQIHFMGGFQFVQKGAKDGDTKTRLSYLEVPVYATYWTNSIANGNIFGGIGPYIAYGIGGKIKSSTGSVKSFDKTGGYKPFDAGLSITAGYKMINSFSFRLAFDLGIANILRDASTGKAKNSAFSLNIGYPLRKLIKGM